MFLSRYRSGHIRLSSTLSTGHTGQHAVYFEEKKIQPVAHTMSPTSRPAQSEEKALVDLLQTEDGRSAFAHRLLETLGSEGRAYLFDRVFGPAAVESQGNVAFATLIAARQYNTPERQALEIASLMRFFEYRKMLLSNALPATKVAEMLGVSRQTIHDRLKSGHLLGVMDNNALKFPEWQFDPQGPNGVVDGLTDVTAALACNVFAKISWLSSSNAVFAGLRPIDALKRGQVADVVREARSVGAT